MARVEESLENWRQSLRRGGALSADELEELETHVQDLAKEFFDLGLTREEAVLVALRRVGDPVVLTLEFAKVNPGLSWSRRFYWMALGSVASLVTWLMVRLVATLTAGVAVAVSGPFALPAVTYGLAALATVSGVLGLMEWTSRYPSGRLAGGMRWVLGWSERHSVAAGLGLFVVVVALVGLGNAANAVFVKGLSGASTGRQALLHIAGVDLVGLGAFPVLATAFTRRLARRSEAGRVPVV